MKGLKERLVSSLNHLNNLNVSKYLLNDQDHGKHVPYGTAGFRGKATQVEHLFVRVGLVAGLRCWTQQANVGLMVTASHNPVEDNGVKFIDSTGEMLASEWERVVEEFCNHKALTVQEVVTKLLNLVDDPTLNVSTCDDVDVNHSNGLVFIGYDTRPSSKRLVELVQIGLDAWTIIGYRNMGEITTPALHHIVAQSTSNCNNQIECKDYYDKLINGFMALFSESDAKQKHIYDKTRLVVDCANGVGALTMKYLFREHSDLYKKHLPAKLINVAEQKEDVLNHGCGADYVKTKHLPPRGANLPGKRYASLDGDADRVVYFYLKDDSDDCLELLLLDGDKILALYAKYLTDVLKQYHLKEILSLGAIQTAYANGASTDFLKDKLGIVDVDCVETGVKNLHRQALSYDIGIYFEANGHGTIWFSDKAKALIDAQNIKELKQMLGILNNYTGDAISDILLVEMILHHYDMDIEQWNELYQDRPNSLIKVEVADRGYVVTTNSGRTCIRPEGLQSEVDKIVSRYTPGSRSFVRASGTENVVRVYAEADNQEAADQLAQLVGEKVIEFCNR